MEHYCLDVGRPFFDQMDHKAKETDGEVVIVIQRPGERVLLITKSFYPTETYRLPTGQIRRGETPDKALEREALEETGLVVSAAKLLGTICCTFRSDSYTVGYTSHVYLTEQLTGSPVVKDADELITGFSEIGFRDLCTVAQTLRALPGTWKDWGAFRALAHDFVYRKTYGQDKK